MTTIINYFGAPNSGKSVQAANTFYNFKTKGIRCELVSEYVKEWAWQNRTIEKYDQLFIVMNQVHRETILFGKVDYIITDSPVVLGVFYDEFYSNGFHLTRPSILQYLKLLEIDGIKCINYWLEYEGFEDNSGRYHNHEDSMRINKLMKQWLLDFGIKFDLNQPFN